MNPTTLIRTPWRRSEVRSAAKIVHTPGMRSTAPVRTERQKPILALPIFLHNTLNSSFNPIRVHKSSRCHPTSSLTEEQDHRRGRGAGE